MKTTLCEVVADPDAFDGKMIELRADVFAGLEANLLYDKNCKLGQFPARIELVAKSAARVDRPVVKPQEDSEYRKFWKLVGAYAKPRGKQHHTNMPDQNTVTATFVGRLDLTRHLPHATGFDEQFVLQAVRDVTTRPFDEALLKPN